MNTRTEDTEKGDAETRRKEAAPRNIRSFRDLRVWQLAMDLVVKELSKRFPAEEKYSLTDQIRRSSRSVPANIAEAWRKRRYPAAFVAKLNDSEGESAETQTHLEIAVRLKYLLPQDIRPLDASYEEVLAMLTSMASKPQQWTIRRHEDTERGDAGTR